MRLAVLAAAVVKKLRNEEILDFERMRNDLKNNNSWFERDRRAGASKRNENTKCEFQRGAKQISRVKTSTSVQKTKTYIEKVAYEHNCEQQRHQQKTRTIATM
jgi:hypothetical protein